MANHEELFLSHTPQAPGSNAEPTPKPLRIQKQPTPGEFTSSQSSEPSQQWAQYRVPPTSSAAYGAPTSPPPSGPLPRPYQQQHAPYPSDNFAGRRGSPFDGQRTGTPQEEDGRGAEYSGARRQSMASSDASGRSGGRMRFDANDPRRPTLGGYGVANATSPTSQIADRRGKPVVHIPIDSPGGPEPPHKSDNEGGDDDHDDDESGTLFSIPPVRMPAQVNTTTIPSNQQQYYPPPLGGAPAPNGLLHIPNPTGISRLSSTASTSTTRASRGSPPPPETPIDGPASGLAGIEARYAASGIPGAGTLNEMQAQSAAAAARRAQYVSPQPRQGVLSAHPALAQPGPASNDGRWSPTERPDSAPHGPPIAFQGTEEISSRGEEVPSQTRPRQQSYGTPNQEQMENGMERLNVNEEPPPAYSPPAPGSVHSQYPNEKGRYANSASPANSTASSGPRSAAADPAARQHPAFAPSAQVGTPSQSIDTTLHENSAHGLAPINIAQANQNAGVGTVGGPVSPPPLPEGWIAHLDPNSGQYYYIHLPTQSTQWEFPKGPTPLNIQEPMSPVGNPLASPVGSIFKRPLMSPGFGPVPHSATFDPQAGINPLASPTATGFTGPPPSAGVDVYKVAPTNGVYFGPYLRYVNMDLERGVWLGSIMLITDAAQPPTIHIHQTVDLSPNPRQLKAHPIHSHQRWIFYRYDLDLPMEEDHAAKWTYAITSHLGCTRYEFLVAGRHETSWRFIAHSGNDFALNVSSNERARLGGLNLMWKDVLLKHQECGGFHTQVGLGGQIYADRLWKDVAALKQWTQTSGKQNRKNAPWSPKLDEDVVHAFFHYYTSHFDQQFIREAFAQIPHVSCLDDHDIFDGYGSYPEYMQQSHVFKNVGRIGTDMFLLFQHHTTHEILRSVNNDIDLFTITGQGWHFLKYFGPSVVVVGPDTRSERTSQQVMAGPTYQGLFPKVAVLPPSVQHCIWLMPVPIVYPRLEAVEQVAHTVATGKKVVTGGFNMLGKVAGGVAGVVGARSMVNSGFDGVKKAVGKSGLMQNVLSPFGEIDVLDELRDMWTHESKDLERTYIIRTLQGVAHNKSLRMTFLSGSVNACGAGLFHDPAHPSDHKTMYQLISASIVNAPQPNYVIKLLHNNKPLYIPPNGQRSTPSQPTDTKEDMMEIFAADVDGKQRELRRLMGRRNYLACVAYDPELVQGAFGSPSGKGHAPGRLSLAADFMVQGEGAFGQPMKYGPVIIPSLEYGR